MWDYVIDRSHNVFQKQIFNFEIDRRLSVQNDADYNPQWLFSLNVKLAEIDEGYAADAKNTAALVGFFHDLNMVMEKKLLTNHVKIVSVLKFKCSFLLYKIIRRLEKTEKIDISIYNDKFSISELEDILRKHPLGQFFDFLTSRLKGISIFFKVTKLHISLQ